MPSASATRRAVSSISARTAPCSGFTSMALATCTRGITSTCVGAVGLMSRNANVPSVSGTTSAGMSPARILQNGQSAATAYEGRTKPRPQLAIVRAEPREDERAHDRAAGRAAECRGFALRGSGCDGADRKSGCAGEPLVSGDELAVEVLGYDDVERIRDRQIAAELPRFAQ